ncbi:MAG: hypothetical protein ACRDHN_08730 [Thermomicrobiales bacterium]
MAENLDGNVQLTPGMEVHDANGETIGKIIEVNEDEFVVEKGFFFPKDYVATLALVDRVDENDHVVLRIPKTSLTEDVTGERSTVDLELAGSTSFDPTIAAGAGVFPQQAGIEDPASEPRRKNQ